MFNYGIILFIIIIISNIFAWEKDLMWVWGGDNLKIDFHVHITPPDIIKDWEKIAQGSLISSLSESPVNKFATADDVIEELESSGVDKAVVFGFAFKILVFVDMSTTM